MMQILGTTLQNLVARDLFTRVMEMLWGNYISPTHNTSIQAHHIQQGLIVVPRIRQSPDTRHRGLGSLSGQSMCDFFTE